uniref:Transient receptor potential protein n=1 Tax=Cacopsylla melanoneura TaxID=428564 RepID=A0A8D8UUQ2_9HEMI
MKAGDSKEELLGSVHNIARQDYCTEAPTEVALTREEKRFLLVAERGDVATTKKMLDELKEKPEVFNINCVDPLNRSALIAAIENENIELINLLLDYNIQVKDALLHAIKEEYVEAVEILLEWEEKIHVHGQPYSWEAVDRSSSTFTPDITPLVLAAHMNNYEILKILLDRGATLPMPHDVRCGCDECVASSEHDSLRHSQARINAYRALSSPSLIALSSRDPLLTAFELSWELRRLRTMETEFRADYNEMRGIVQQFATSLLDQTRTSYELEVLLNHNPGGDVWQPGERQSLERLKLGIKYKQKEFVAHPSVQQLLAARWYEGLPGFRRKTMIAQMFEVGKMGAMFAMYSTMYMMAPESELGKFLKKPFVKFICHSASYGFFLMLLALASQRAEYLAIELFGPDWMQEILMEWKRKERGSIPTLIESGIIFYIISLVWGEMRALWSDGLLEYVTDLWNIVDFLNNIFYMLWIFLRFTAWFLVQKELSLGMEPWYPKEKWHAFDPHLLSEGAFAAGMIFSFLKLVHIFSVNPHLGPLQISLGRMIIDIIKFFFIYTLVLFAFGCGLNQLLWYYADLERAKCYHLRDDYPDFDGQDKACSIWRRFSNLFETSQSLFWASFGLVDLTAFDLTGIKNFTRFWALLLFGSYSVINIIVLLNMLIAMMSNSYQIISERSDTEWKFARSTLWISYFEEGDTVPPPFNLFPTAKFMKRMLGMSKREKSGSIINKSREKAQERHDLVVRLLIRRYVVAEQRKRDQFGITEDDVMEIRQDISTVRFELIDILRNNGMKTPKLDQENITGKKGRVMERRLLKDFQIGMVEGIVNDALTSDKGGTKDVFSKIAKAIGRKATGTGSKKKDWNAIARQKSERRDPIGSSSEAHIRRSRQSLRRHIIENQGSALTSMDPEKLIEYNPKLSEMPPSARVAYAKFKMPKIKADYDNKVVDGKSIQDDVFDNSTVVNEKTPQGSIIRPRPKPPSRTTSISSAKIPGPEDLKDFRSRTPIPEDPNERRTPTPEPASVKTDAKPVTAVAAPALKPPETKVQPPTPTKIQAPAPPDTKAPASPKPPDQKPSPNAGDKPATSGAKSPAPAKPQSSAPADSKSTSKGKPVEEKSARVTKPGGKSKVTGEVLTGWL